MQARDEMEITTSKTKWARVLGKIKLVALQTAVGKGESYFLVNGIRYDTEIEAEAAFASLPTISANAFISSMYMEEPR